MDILDWSYYLYVLVTPCSSHADCSLETFNSILYHQLNGEPGLLHLKVCLMYRKPQSRIRHPSISCGFPGSCDFYPRLWSAGDSAETGSEGGW